MVSIKVCPSVSHKLLLTICCTFINYTRLDGVFFSLNAPCVVFTFPYHIENTDIYI